jgi:hypothetical protein
LPPSDAIVLFDGTDLSKWVSTKDNGTAKWLVKDGYMEVVASTGDIRTREEFGDCQLHVEWAAPTEIKGSSQGRGNSGVFLMGLVEIQVLDIYNNPTYADGGAGSIYGVNPPMVNAVRAPGQFQSYDIVFRRPISKDGKMVDPGHVTVFVNGVVVQDATPLEGPTGHMKRTVPAPFPEKGPLKLQDHGNPMRFRNIWYRPLPPRPIEGGTDGKLTPEATMAKRREIAAGIREDASKKEGLGKFLRLMESLAYEQNAEASQQVQNMAAEYLATVQKLSADQVKGKKDEIRNVQRAVNYTVDHGFLPKNLALKAELDRIVKENKWDK